MSDQPREVHPFTLDYVHEAEGDFSIHVLPADYVEPEVVQAGPKGDAPEGANSDDFVPGPTEEELAAMLAENEALRQAAEAEAAAKVQAPNPPPVPASK